MSLLTDVMVQDVNIATGSFAKRIRLSFLPPTWVSTFKLTQSLTLLQRSSRRNCSLRPLDPSDHRLSLYFDHALLSITDHAFFPCLKITTTPHISLHVWVCLSRLQSVSLAFAGPLQVSQVTPLEFYLGLTPETLFSWTLQTFYDRQIM